MPITELDVPVGAECLSLPGFPDELHRMCTGPICLKEDWCFSTSTIAQGIFQVAQERVAGVLPWYHEPTSDFSSQKSAPLLMNSRPLHLYIPPCQLQHLQDPHPKCAAWLLPAGSALWFLCILFPACAML